jgi:hypothetical protein
MLSGGAALDGEGSLPLLLLSVAKEVHTISTFSGSQN